MNRNAVQLAIETTGRNGSIALMAGESVLRQTNLDRSQRTAAMLAPAIDETIQWSREHDHVIQFVSVANGPGSFTGLRIGVTTAKTLAYALQLPLIGVDSLAAIAAAAYHTSQLTGDHTPLESLLVAVDAYRGQVFAGEFPRHALLPSLDCITEHWSPYFETVSVITTPQLQDQLASRPNTQAITGDKKPLGDHADAARPRQCDAIGVGLLALRAALQGLSIDPLLMVPRYMKVSAAEENAAKKK
ncbi:MAG: tRNA (adenosine(37)-N6)-threonylcarbamoyltransferase complex dimerization subunit type 1 TsaB [Rubripirellula sp.]